MYDGLSKSDLRIILAHQLFFDQTRKWFDENSELGTVSAIKSALFCADRFLAKVEALSAEPESRRDDGEGEGTRDA